MHRLFTTMLGENSSIIPLLMSKGRKKLIVCISGGCGYMDETQEEHMMSFVPAFAGLNATIIGGGTRMLWKSDIDQGRDRIRPGITEWLPSIKTVAPKCTTVGVIPKIEGYDMTILPDGRIAFNYQEGDDYVTVIMPNNDISLLIQKDVDTGVRWDDEYVTRLKLMSLLRKELEFQSVSVFYNGGATTEKEIIHTAKLGWPVALIRGSGRKTEEYANNEEFLLQYPNVIIAETAEQLEVTLKNGIAIILPVVIIEKN